MSNSEDLEIALQKRVADLIGANLRQKHADVAPLIRVMAAYAAARAIVQRAQETGTLARLEYRLAIAEAGDFEI